MLVLFLSYSYACFKLVVVLQDFHFMLLAFAPHLLFHNPIIFRLRAPSPVGDRRPRMDSLTLLSSPSVDNDCSCTSRDRFFKDLGPLSVDYVPIWERHHELLLLGVMESLIDECTTVEHAIDIDSDTTTQDIISLVQFKTTPV